MADAYIIEISGYTAGIVARDHAGQAFTFFASHPAFYPIEGHRFGAPSAASRAAKRLIDASKGRTRADNALQFAETAP